MARPRCEYTSCYNCGIKDVKFVKGLCVRCYTSDKNGNMHKYKDKPERRRRVISISIGCSNCKQECYSYCRGLCIPCYKVKNLSGELKPRKSKEKTIQCNVCLHRERGEKHKFGTCSKCRKSISNMRDEDANRIKLILIKSKHFHLDREDGLRLVSLFIEYVYGDDERKRPRFHNDTMIKSLTVIYKLITTGEYKEHDDTEQKIDEQKVER